MRYRLLGFREQGTTELGTEIEIKLYLIYLKSAGLLVDRSQISENCYNNVLYFDLKLTGKSRLAAMNK